jgi:hypothetical protein
MAEKLTITNFSLKKETIFERKYILNKNYSIFNKELPENEEPLYIFIHKNFELSDYIEKISDCINWLDTECKNDLIKYFNNNMDPETNVDTKWYDELQIYCVLITINEEGKIGASISCGDNYFNGDTLDIITKENKLDSMAYYENDDYEED